MKKIKSIKSYIQTTEAEEPLLVAFEERTIEDIIIREENYFLDGNLNQAVIRKLDDKGKVIEEMHYSEEGEPDQVLSFSYENSGKLASIKTEYRDGSHDVKSIARNEAENSETTQVIDDEDYMESKVYRRFDSEGNVLEEHAYGEEGTLKQKMKVAYDNHNRPTQTKIEYADGFVKELFYDYVLNDKAQVETVEITDANDKLVHYEHFVYDEKGNRVEHHIQDADHGVAVVYKWEFNDKDQATSKLTLKANGEIIEEEHLEYGPEGQVVAREVVNNRGEETLQKYVYEVHD